VTSSGWSGMMVALRRGTRIALLNTQGYTILGARYVRR
jgi:hypothetical protein